MGITFLVFQLIFQCIFLGIAAFDYVIIKKSHFNWKVLLEIYSIEGIGIYLCLLKEVLDISGDVINEEL